MNLNIETFEKRIHGVRTIYAKVPFTPNVHVRFISKAGSFAENGANQGVAHYLEHMFFKGTDKRNLFDISDDAALLGARQNAYTGNYKVCYHLTGPSINYDGMAELLSDMMFNPVFPEDEIVKERTVIQEERKSYEDNHGSFFFNTAGEHWFNFPFGHNIVGTEDTINSLTRDDFVNYRKDMYCLDNTIFLVVGSIGEEEVFNSCEKYFSECNLNESAKTTMIKPFYINKNDYEFKRDGVQQSFLMGIFEGDTLSEDTTEHSCMIDAIGNSMYSLLFKEVREKLGLCYHISSSQYIKTPNLGTNYIYSQLSEGNVDRAKQAIFNCFENVRQEGFSDKQFQVSRASMLGAMCRGADSLNGIAEGISTKALFDLPFNFQSKYDRICNLSLDKVNECMRASIPSVDDVKWVTMNPE